MSADEIILRVAPPEDVDTVQVQISLTSDDVHVTLGDEHDVITMISVEERGPVGPRGITGEKGETGEQGPPGEVPAPGYVHHQDTASSTWTIQHNLGFFPNITVVDSAGTQMEGGDVQYTSADTVVLHFAVSFGGLAYLS